MAKGTLLRQVKCALFAGIAMELVLGSPASAQDVPAKADGKQSNNSDASNEAIIVTGSRIKRRDYVTASPLVTVGEDILQGSGKTNVDEALALLPQFNGVGNGASIAAFPGPKAINLRGLGEIRSLPLLDGRRLPPSTIVGFTPGITDISFIPNAVISNIEVISGGASAVYGADAVAGVVNIKTRDDFNGVEVSFDYGIAEVGDGENVDLSLLYGGDFGPDKRGHIMLAGSYTRRGEVAQFPARPYLNRPTTPLYGSANVIGGSPFSQSAIDQVFGSYGFAPGTVPATTNIGINPDGTLFAGVGGTNLDTTGLDGYYSIVNGAVVAGFPSNQFALSKTDKYSAFVKADYELTDNVTVYAQGIYTKAKEIRGQAVNTTALIASVPVTNPFIPTDLQTLLASRSNPDANFTLFNSFIDLPTDWGSETQTWQAVGGLRGTFDFADINWDIYYSHTSIDFANQYFGYINTKRRLALINAPDGGASICEGGLNMFSYQHVSQECADYLTTDAEDMTKSRQDVVEATVGGKLFPIGLGASPMRFALTGTWRKNGMSYTPSDEVANGIIQVPIGGQAVPYRTVTVKEIAGELLIPVLQDVPFARSLNINLGGRYSDYSTAGGVETYRVEADYRPVDSVMLRGGYERAVRAGSFSELFLPPSYTQSQFLPTPPVGGDPCSIDTNANAAGGNALRQLCIATGVPSSYYDGSVALPNYLPYTTQGNGTVQPEKADTVTLGLVFQPDFGPNWVRNFNATIDFYSIKIKGLISRPTASDVVTSCYNVDGKSNPGYDPNDINCQQISRDSSGLLSNVIVVPQNIGALKTKGIDVQIDWKVDLGPGKLRVGTYMNFLLEFAFQRSAGLPFVDYAGLSADNFLGIFGDHHPRFKATTNVGYNINGFDAFMIWRHVSGMQDLTQVTSPSSPLPDTASYDVFDVHASYQINDTFTVRGGITNVFDRKPNFLGDVQGLTSFRLYDPIGRAYSMGVTATF
ncbi:hypothetical protein LK12_17105 [Novosphingobium malaysiense]|uniref:TonB-dependent receptor n=2 Tax=Novosphingobium malaysiense TaxID=1348853 RepID=A0A0B1ZM17_9SPHN|nr:hypothetical protein LK12_17105 [Novosphingobium malaysiense]